jgi:hypothetical protein
MDKKTSLFQFYFLLVISIATIIAYTPSINATYFSDDFLYKFHDIEINLKSVFSVHHHYAYRPVEMFFLATLQHASPENTWPIHVTNLFLHLLFSALIMIWMRKQGFSRFSSTLAFAIMALSQANSHAVSSLDTFSQITSSFLGYSAIILFLSSIKNQTRFRYLLYIASLLMTTIAIFCKESAMFIIPSVFLIAIFSLIKYHWIRPRTAIKIVISCAPFLLIAVAFMILRKQLNLQAAATGVDRYNLRLEFNVVKNFLMTLLQALQPHSSVDIYFDIVNNRWVSVAVVMLLSCILATLSIWGIFLSKHRMLSAFLIIMLPVSMFPTILLNHISELYVYSTMPLIAILVGTGLGELFEKHNKHLWKTALLCLISGFLIWNCSSVFRKCELMKQNGLQAEKLLDEIKPYYSEIPVNGNLILVNPNTSNKTEYSIFRLTGFRLFEDGAYELNRRAHRDDFNTIIIREMEFDTVDTSNSLILQYKQNKVCRFNR